MDQTLNTAETKGPYLWDAAGGNYPRVRTDELFELKARERPDDTAISFLGKSMSYGSLNTATHLLATRLQNLGVQRETLVGVCMDRCTEMVTALLAIFRTGAA